MGIFDIDYYAPYIRYDTVFGGKHHEWTRINPEYKAVYVDGDFSKKEKKDMKKLTKEEAIKMHRAMWSYIAAKSKAEKRVVRKKEVINDLFPDYAHKLIDDCFLCQYSFEQNDDTHANKCRKCCPLYDNHHSDTRCLNGLFSDYQGARDIDDYERVSEVAMKIASLIEVEKNKYEHHINHLKAILAYERDRAGSKFNRNNYRWNIGSDIISEIVSSPDYAISINYDLIGRSSTTNTLFGIPVEENYKDREATSLFINCEDIR